MPRKAAISQVHSDRRGAFIDAGYVKAWTKLEDNVYNFQQNSIV